MALSASGSGVNPVPSQPSFWPWLWLCCSSIRRLLKHTHSNQFVFRMIHWEGDKFSLFSFTRVNWSFKRPGKSKLYTIVYARFCLFCFLAVLLLWGFCCFLAVLLLWGFCCFLAVLLLWGFCCFLAVLLLWGFCCCGGFVVSWLFCCCGVFVVVGFLLLWGFCCCGGFCAANQTWLLQCPVDFMDFIRSKQADKIWFSSGHLGSFLATSLHQGCPRNFVEKMFLTLNSRLTRLQNDIPKWLVAASSFGHV